MKKLLLTLAIMGSLGPAAQAQIANPGMESWRTYTSGLFMPMTLEAPDGWYGADSLMAYFMPLFGSTANKQVFKSTEAHSGSFAAKIVTQVQGDLGEVPGVLMNAQPQFELTDTTLSYSGGTPISSWVDTVYAWVKYNHPGEFPEDDTAQITAVALKEGAGTVGPDSIVGMGKYMILPTATYTKVGLKMDYASPLQPDRIVIIFSSSPFNMQTGFGSAALEGSTLYVDDVSLVMGSLAVQPLSLATDEVFVYPNPASDVLHIATSTRQGILSLEVYNAAGQHMAQQRFETQLQLNTSGFAAGNYFYHLRNDKGRVVKKGKFQIAR